MPSSFVARTFWSNDFQITEQTKWLYSSVECPQYSIWLKERAVTSFTVLSTEEIKSEEVLQRAVMVPNA